MICEKQNPVLELTSIKDKILGLDVIDIRATNQQESYNIFEILNARGVDLKQHELIKNYIFKYIHPRANVDIAKMLWDTMEQKLYINKKSCLDNFFTHYVTHKYEKPQYDNTEFRIIKQYCDRQNMKSLLEDLCEKADIYRMFYCTAECSNSTIKDTLQFFYDNNHRQFRPLFLSVLSAYKHNRIQQDQIENFFVFIRNFYFGYAIVCNGKSNAIEDIIYTYARKIENDDAVLALSEFSEKLQNYYPSYKMFESNFVLLGWSHCNKSYKTASRKRQVQYILSSLEQYLLSNNNELSVNKYTIEHIANDDGTTEHCQIGNLLLLAEPINNNAGSKVFEEKIAYYKKSNYISTKKFVERYGDREKWNKQDILTRGKYMAKLAYEQIWKI